MYKSSCILNMDIYANKKHYYESQLNTAINANNNSKWNPILIICPECGAKINGYKNKNGEINLTCFSCAAIIHSKIKTPGKKVIIVYKS